MPYKPPPDPLFEVPVKLVLKLLDPSKWPRLKKIISQKHAILVLEALRVPDWIFT